MVDDIFKICDAYESGMGHGLEVDNLPNPYSIESDEYKAYEYGYNLGKERSGESLERSITSDVIIHDEDVDNIPDSDLVLYATSDYAKGFGIVKGVTIRHSKHWKEFKRRLLNGETIHFYGRKYKLKEFV